MTHLADDLAALIVARETATKGPWAPLTHGTRSQEHAAALAHDAVMARRLPDSPDVEFTDMSWVRTEDEDWLNVALVGNGKDGPENSKFIALAANVIDAHGAELAALVTENARLRAALEHIERINSGPLALLGTNPACAQARAECAELARAALRGPSSVTPPDFGVSVIHEGWPPSEVRRDG